MAEPADDLARVGVFARAWAKALTGTSYFPLTHAQLETLLQRLTDQLAEALRSEPLDLRAGHRVAAELVAAHIGSAEALGRTVEVIQLRLVRDLDLVTDDIADRMARLIAAIATGYARALRDRTLDEQEAIRRAAQTARAEAERALRASEARFRHQATHDPLTDLPNRTLFADRLAAVCAGHPAGDQRVGLCFLDIDRFKRINDSYGHQIGDRALVAAAHRLSRAVEPHLVARLGGDAFMILVERSTGTGDVVAVAESALAAMAEPALVGGHDITVTASVGVVERRVAGTTPDDLLRAAGSTLQWAKHAGGAGWALYDAERDGREQARQALSAAIPGGLERGEFYLDYQPLTSLQDGSMLGVEALVRWRHPQLGVLRPDRFIGLAEETGLIVPLGSWVLAEACREAVGWSARTGEPPYVSVNLAVRQVRQVDLVQEVCGLLQRTGLPPDRLQLEITESMMMSSAEQPVRALRALADLGVRIAIDDFGTGYSNLAYLRDLPVTELKVAGEFVRGLRAPEAPDERILASLVSLAHALDLTVTAEGVETVGQAERLRAIGCDAGQGWHFGRPAPAEHILARLR
ncbi:putative bifunctional diguanylate cyclase/phosphodiesterase [Micromonospora sp. NPDC048871]|uniref:putative bifunctional diguanylate cyclase/phosphodiesterase n=1 Tax=unclassified Micromonospora TaxID=2617518 RepID=UPI0033E1DBCD